MEKWIAVAVLIILVAAFLVTAIYMAVKISRGQADSKDSIKNKEGIMSKNFVYYLLTGLSIAAALVLWLLKIIMPEQLSSLSYSWIAFIAAAGCGAVFLTKGLLQKNTGILKKLNIYFGAGLIVVAFLCVVFALTLSTKIVPPVIAIIVTAALVLGIIVCGGKKWDHGDNQDVGYKNYYQRKADEDKKKEENKDSENK